MSRAIALGCWLLMAMTALFGSSQPALANDYRSPAPANAESDPSSLSLDPFILAAISPEIKQGREQPHSTPSSLSTLPEVK